MFAGYGLPDDLHRQDDMAAVGYERGVSMGDDELGATWRDSGFDAEHHGFYYVRVLETPTRRWSSWDAVRVGVAPRVSLPATIQERAWSSPIWISPGS